MPGGCAAAICLGCACVPCMAPRLCRDVCKKSAEAQAIAGQGFEVYGELRRCAGGAGAMWVWRGWRRWVLSAGAVGGRDVLGMPFVSLLYAAGVEGWGGMA